MEDAQPSTEVQLLPQPEPAGEDSPRVVRIAALVPSYSCVACGAHWPYRVVRNTGRCPACGGGLRRDADWP